MEAVSGEEIEGWGWELPQSEFCFSDFRADFSECSYLIADWTHVLIWINVLLACAKVEGFIVVLFDCLYLPGMTFLLVRVLGFQLRICSSLAPDWV